MRAARPPAQRRQERGLRCPRFLLGGEVNVEKGWLAHSQQKGGSLAFKGARGCSVWARGRPVRFSAGSVASASARPAGGPFPRCCWISSPPRWPPSSARSCQRRPCSTRFGTMLIPMLFIDLRTRVRPCSSCSDASEEAGGGGAPIPPLADRRPGGVGPGASSSRSWGLRRATRGPPRSATCAALARAARGRYRARLNAASGALLHARLGAWGRLFSLPSGSAHGRASYVGRGLR